MKNSNKVTLVAVAVLAAVGAGIATSGIDGGGRARGAVTRFGSIFVNDVEYHLNTAQIRINGAPATEADLRIGQVVTVDGFVNADLETGNAVTVEFDSDVRGLVASVDPVSASMRVLGQTVRVNGGTTFDEAFTPANLGGVAPGSVVEISGYRNSIGEVVATHVARSPAVSDRVLGTVADLDVGLGRFRIGALTVDYSAASLVEGGIANGAQVEVEGARASGLLLRAQTIETRSTGLGGEPGSGASLEGVVTGALAGGRFEVNGQPVVITPSTQFLLGSIADLVIDAKVEAEGRMDAAGAIVAQTVQFRWDDAAVATATVQAVDARAGTIRVLGLTGKVDAGTRFEDRSDARLRRMSLADLRVGDSVVVRGVELREARSLLVTRITRERPGVTRLHARLTDLTPTGFRLVELPVNLLPSTATEEFDGRPVSRADFMRRAPNRNVNVRGTFDGVSLTAIEVTLEQ